MRMNGEIFVSNLANLNLKTSRNLKANDFEWIFQKEPEYSLSHFWQFFFDHYQQENLLTDDQIRNYKELEDESGIHSKEYLEKFFSSTAFEERVNKESLFCGGDDGFSESELQEMETEIERVETRHNYLMLQKLQIESHLKEKQDTIAKLNSKLKKEEIKFQCRNRDYFSALMRLHSSREEAVNKLKNCDSDAVAFFSQLHLDELRSEHESFCSIIEYVLDAKSDSSHSSAVVFSTENCENDSTFLSTFHDASNMGCNPRELMELTKLLEDTEVAKIDYEILKSSKKAELQGSLDLLSEVKANNFHSLQKIIDLKNSGIQMASALQQDLDIELKFLKKEALFVAQKDRFTLLASSYERHLLDQIAVDSQISVIKDQLVNHLSRLEFLKLLHFTDSSFVRRIVVVLHQICDSFHQECDSVSSRLINLENLQLELKQGKIHSSDNELNFLAKILNIDGNMDKIEGFVMEILQSLKSHETELSSAVKAQSRTLTTLHESSSLLANCLLSIDGKRVLTSLTALSGSGIPERNAKVEENSTRLQKNISKVIADFEEKKKMLKGNQEIADEKRRWIQYFNLGS